MGIDKGRIRALMNGTGAARRRCGHETSTLDNVRLMVCTVMVSKRSNSFLYFVNIHLIETFVSPKVAQIRGFRVKRIMEPPALLHYLCGSYQPPMFDEGEEEHFYQD